MKIKSRTEIFYRNKEKHCFKPSQLKRYFNTLVVVFLLLIANKLIAGDDLSTVRACGSALDGDNPCDWIKKIDVGVSYEGKDKELKLDIFNFVNDWFERKKWLIHKDGEVDVVDKSGRHFYFQPPKKTINVNVLVSDLDRSNDTLVTSIVINNKHGYQVYSYSCDSSNMLGLRKCLFEKVDKGLSLLLNRSFRK